MSSHNAMGPVLTGARWNEEAPARRTARPRRDRRGPVARRGRGAEVRRPQLLVRPQQQSEPAVVQRPQLLVGPAFHAEPTLPCPEPAVHALAPAVEPVAAAFDQPRPASFTADLFQPQREVLLSRPQDEPPGDQPGTPWPLHAA